MRGVAKHPFPSLTYDMCDGIQQIEEHGGQLVLDTLDNILYLSAMPSVSQLVTLILATLAPISHSQSQFAQ